MTSHEAGLYLQRLHELAASLQMDSIVAFVDAAATAEPETQAAKIRSACLSIARQLSPSPSPTQGAVELGKRYAPILRQMELMSLREMADFDRSAATACETARQSLESLPLLWQRTAITSIADFRLSPADLNSPTPDPSSRLQRRLTQALGVPCASLARELYAGLLPTLLKTLARSLPLLLACDELVRAVQQKTHTGDLTGTLLDRGSSLEEQMLDQEKIYSEPPSESEPPSPSILELTALFKAPLASALSRLRIDIPCLPEASDSERSAAFKQTAIAATFTLIDEAWTAQRAVILDHGFAFITDRYTAFKREIDIWLAEQQAILAEASGIVAPGDFQRAAIRFEVEAIARRAEALSPAR